MSWIPRQFSRPTLCLTVASLVFFSALQTTESEHLQIIGNQSIKSISGDLADRGSDQKDKKQNKKRDKKVQKNRDKRLQRERDLYTHSHARADLDRYYTRGHSNWHQDRIWGYTPMYYNSNVYYDPYYLPYYYYAPSVYYYTPAPSSTYLNVRIN